MIRRNSDVLYTVTSHCDRSLLLASPPLPPLIRLALQLASREQVLEEVDGRLLLVALAHPALVGVGQAQVESLAVVVLAPLLS